MSLFCELYRVDPVLAADPPCSGLQLGLTVLASLLCSGGQAIPPTAHPTILELLTYPLSPVTNMSRVVISRQGNGLPEGVCVGSVLWREKTSLSPVITDRLIESSHQDLVLQKRPARGWQQSCWLPVK